MPEYKNSAGGTTQTGNKGIACQCEPELELVSRAMGCHTSLLPENVQQPLLLGERMDLADALSQPPPGPRDQLRTSIRAVFANMSRLLIRALSKGTLGMMSQPFIAI